MKKLILSLLPFVLISLMIQAQTLTLSNGEGDVPDGSEISLLASPDVYEIESHIFVTNNTEDTVDVWMRKIETNVIPETINTFCWGGSCYGPGQDTSTQSSAIPGGATDSASFSGHYQPGGHEGTSVITYLFYTKEEPVDSVRFTVNYISGHAGLVDHLLAETELSEAYPNPSSHQAFFDYKLPNGINNATLVVHNLLGSKVNEIKIIEPSGKIELNTGELYEGKPG
jgi:hypothetical protein